MDTGNPPLKTKILLESNPLKSRILVRRLAVQGTVELCQDRKGPSRAAEGSGPSPKRGRAVLLSIQNCSPLGEGSRGTRCRSAQHIEEATASSKLDSRAG